MDLSQIARANVAIEDGAWVPSPMFPGVKHRIRGSSSLEARRLRDKLVNAIPRVARANGLSEADSTIIENRVLADVIWLEVDGLTENGTPIILTPEKALELLQNPAYALLRDDIRAAAMRVGDEHLADQADAAKN